MTHRVPLDQAPEMYKTFRDKKLPCDAVIYLGTGYCPAGWNIGHGTFEFNPKTFEKPEESMKRLHDLNFRVVLHINRAPRTMFCTSIAEKSDDPNHIRNYWAKHNNLVKLGVDGWWPDDGDELPAEARLARHRCYYEGPLADVPNVRPWSLQRNGYPGIAQWGGWVWSGDTESSWKTLEAQIAVGINYSLSIGPYWGSDIGGFYPNNELTGELYARWHQFAAFCGSFRSHGRTWWRSRTTSGRRGSPTSPRTTWRSSTSARSGSSGRCRPGRVPRASRSPETGATPT